MATKSPPAFKKAAAPFGKGAPMPKEKMPSEKFHAIGKNAGKQKFPSGSRSKG